MWDTVKETTQSHLSSPFIFALLFTKFNKSLFLKINPEMAKLNEQKTLPYPFPTNSILPPPLKILLLAAWRVPCKCKQIYIHHVCVCAISIYFLCFSGVCFFDFMRFSVHVSMHGTILFLFYSFRSSMGYIFFTCQQLNIIFFPWKVSCSFLQKKQWTGEWIFSCLSGFHLHVPCLQHLQTHGYFTNRLIPKG